MKNNLRIIFTLTAFCVVFGCAVSVFGQIKAGGYKTASISDAGVKAAADFAIATKAAEFDQDLTLDSILKAETQVVAGTNYRLCLQITAPSDTEGDDDITINIKTVIYRNLKGKYKMTSWEDEDCAEK